MRGIARTAWVVVAVFTVVAMVASVPVLFERFSTLCVDGPNACLQRSEVPARALGGLRGAGVSLEATR